MSFLHQNSAYFSALIFKRTIFRKTTGFSSASVKIFLIVLTNEKRGGSKVASFERPRFKLFTLKRSLFLLFEYNNCANKGRHQSISQQQR